MADTERASRAGDAEAAAKLVRALAQSPRFAGSTEEEKARRLCAQRLSESGFTVEERAFGYSYIPAQLVLPLTAGLLIVLTAYALLMYALGGVILALSASLATAAIVLLIARYLTGPATLTFPWGRATATNLIASPARKQPDVWLVAHIDSKSQSIPMLLRMTAISSVFVFFGLMVAGQLIWVLTDILLAPWPELDFARVRIVRATPVMGMIAIASAVPLIFGATGNRSPGALDNATGVAAVLLAADLVRDRNVGVLITSAEELGLAGARAFVAQAASPAIAINCDTIDSVGQFICMARGQRSQRLDAAIDRAATAAAINTRRPRGRRYARLQRMLPGVLADNIAFTEGGWDSFTLSRGNLRTLARVHTSRDRADSIDGTGMVQAALLIAGTVEELS